MKELPTASWWFSRFLIWGVVTGILTGITWGACALWKGDEKEIFLGLMALTLIGWSVVLSLAAKGIYAKLYGGLTQATGEWFELVLVILYVWFYPLVVMLTPLFSGSEAILAKRNPGVAAVGLVSWSGAIVIALVATL